MSSQIIDPFDISKVQVTCVGDSILLNATSAILTIEQTDRLVQVLLMAKEICRKS